MQLISHTPQIWSIDNFLSHQECDDLVLFSETKGYQEAEVNLPKGAKMMKGIRNNYFYDLSE